MDEENEVTPAAEEPTEEAETETTEAAQEPQEPAEDIEEIRKKAAAFEDQRKRAESAEAELKKLKGPKQPQNPRALSSEDRKRLDRIELNSVGVTNREDQDFVLSAAKRLGVDPSEAARDEIVAAKLERMRETRASAEATPAPTKGSGSTKPSKLPDFSKMSDADFDKWEREHRR